MSTQGPPSLTGKRQQRFAQALRGIVGQLMGENAMFVEENSMRMSHLDKLIGGAAKLGITKAKRLTPTQLHAIPMSIANMMLSRREAAREEVERKLHEELVKCGVEHHYLERIWSDPRPPRGAPRKAPRGDQ